MTITQQSTGIDQTDWMERDGAETRRLIQQSHFLKRFTGRRLP